MKNLRNCYAAFLLFALLFVAAAAPAQTDLQQKLGRISAITETRPLESTRFSEKYVTYFTQPLDHRRPEKGSFRQRVIVSHVGFDRPTVIVTEGYGAAYALNPKYREELSELLDANMIFVEYRYFLESTPEPKDWQYLTAENSADDLHAVRNAFKSIYPGKWIATGISKGGQTTLLYRTFYPDDVDISVPYVAPLCYGAEDGRHEPFLRKVSTPEDRKRIEDFQLEVLKRKAALLPALRNIAMKKDSSSVRPLKRYTTIACWSILLPFGSGELPSAASLPPRPRTMRYLPICSTSVIPTTSLPTVPQPHSSCRPPANWAITATIRSLSRSIFPSNRARITCIASCSPKS